MQAHSFRQNLASFHPRGQISKGEKVGWSPSPPEKAKCFRNLCEKSTVISIFAVSPKTIVWFRMFYQCMQRAKSKNDFASTVVPHI